MQTLGCPSWILSVCICNPLVLSARLSMALARLVLSIGHSQTFTDHGAQVHPYAHMGLIALTMAAKVCIDHVMASINVVLDRRSHRKRISTNPSGISLSRSSRLTSSFWKTPPPRRSTPLKIFWHKSPRSYGNVPSSSPNILKPRIFVCCLFLDSLREGFIHLTGHRLGKNVFSETATRIANYNSKLDTLMQEF